MAVKNLRYIGRFIPLHIRADVGGGQKFVGPDNYLGREECVDRHAGHMLEGSTMQMVESRILNLES